MSQELKYLEDGTPRMAGMCDSEGAGKAERVSPKSEKQVCEVKRRTHPSVPTLLPTFSSFYTEEPGGWRIAKLGEASEQLHRASPTMVHHLSAQQGQVEYKCSHWENRGHCDPGWGSDFQETVLCYEASLEVSCGFPPSVPLAI